MTLADASKIEFGAVTFTVTPEGDDLRHYADFALAGPVTFLPIDGDKVTATLPIERSKLTWSRTLVQALGFDFGFGKIEMAGGPSNETATIEGATAMLTTSDGADGRFNQDMKFGAGAIEIVSAIDGTIRMAAANLDAKIVNVDLAAFQKLDAEYRAAVGAGDMVKASDLIAQMFKAMGGFESALTIDGLSQANTDGSPSFTMGSTGFEIGMAGTDQPESTLSLGLAYAGLSVPDMAQDLGAAMADLVPHGAAFNLEVGKVPTEQLIALATQSMAELGSAGPEAMEMIGMMVMSSFQAAMAQSGSTLSLTDSHLENAISKTLIDGLFVMDQAAAWGASGTLNIAIADFDAVAAKANEADPAGEQMIEWLKSISQEEPGADGKPVRKFAVALEPDGRITINGQDMPM